MDNRMYRPENIRKEILIVEDIELNREILGEIMAPDYNIHYAANGQEALEILRERGRHLSCVLLDLIMPVMDGYQLLEIMHGDDKLKDLPVIVLTSEKSAEVETLRLGAVDFIPKPYDSPEVIRTRVWKNIELSEKRMIVQSTERDPLTGLYAKDYFFEYAEQVRQYDLSRSIDAVVIDIDHFRLLNELQSREFGDTVLKTIGESLKVSLQPGIGIACRASGDTFFVYRRHSDNYEELHRKLEEDLSRLTEVARIRFRVGVYQNVDQSLSVPHQFDMAKYACDSRSNDFNRNISYYDTELHEKELFEEKLIHGIDEAIRDKQLIVYFQPKFDITGEEPVLSSAEALIRWNHPQFGMVSPGIFIPLFERNGMIHRVDSYVWEETARLVGQWKEKWGITIQVSVNVSRIDVYDENLRKRMSDLVERYGIDPKDFLLEITESAYSEDVDQLMAALQGLREDGFRIELDDFGSGYSCLSMLSTMPIDVIKMDMSFIRNVEKDERSIRMIELIMEIARFLSVPVVAEGVENEEQYRMIRETGCDRIQGHYFSRPLPAEEFEQLLLTEKQIVRP